MREEEEERSWFARWEEQLPSPEELMPLSQTLITPDLALAFDIPTHHPSSTPTPSTSRHHQHHQPPPPPPSSSSQQHQGGEYEAGDAGNGGGGGGGGGEEPARTLKRPRLVWTPQLHKRFVDAVAHLGIKNAVPKTIMQLMSVDGLTRENVASHLQKYRLYLKRVQGLSNPSSSSPPGGPVSAADAADQQLFATAPVPPHFLARGGPADPFGPPPPPYSSMAALQHHPQMAVVQQHQQYYNQRHVSHFGSPPGHAGGFDHTGFLQRAMPLPGMHRIVGPATGISMVQPPPPPPAASYIEDLESGTGGGGGRRVLTLFPTGDD